jgi:hypothetical protein
MASASTELPACSTLITVSERKWQLEPHNARC